MRGAGGTVYFSFTLKGYRIAKPAAETVDGMACRSQLYIPGAKTIDQWRNICLQGEMPVTQLHAYQLLDGSGKWPATEFPLTIDNCVLFSDWEAPENTSAPGERPWSLISVLDSG
jgi:hypothetical protein